MMTTSVILIVSPSLNADGRKAYSTRGPLFGALVDGRPIVTRSTTPFCDAARALLAQEVDPATVLVMRQKGADYNALRSTIGSAAGLTVKDGGDGKPRLAKWRANDFHRAGMILGAIPSAKWDGTISSLVRRNSSQP